MLSLKGLIISYEKKTKLNSVVLSPRLELCIVEQAKIEKRQKESSLVVE